MESTMVMRVKMSAVFLCAIGLSAGLSLQAVMAAPKTDLATDSTEVKKDFNGDPLPAGAVGRMGTPRLRHPGLGGPYYDPGTVAFLPDGKTLFSAGCWSFRFWDVASGQKTGGIDLEKDELPQKSTLAACALAPDGKSVAMSMRYEADIRLLDAATGKEIRRFIGHNRGNGVRSVTQIDFSPGGKTLGSVATDGTIRLWDVASGKEKPKLGDFDPVKRIPIGLQGDIKPFLKFSPTGKHLVTKDGSNVRLWDVTTGKELYRLGADGANAQNPQGPGGLGIAWQARPDNMAFTPDGRVVAVGLTGMTTGGVVRAKSSVSLWETLTGKRIREIQTQAPVLAMAFSADGKTLAVGGGSMPYRGVGVVDREQNDFGIQLYDWARGKSIQQCTGHNRALYSLAFSPDGKALASVAGDDTVRLWDPATGQEIRRGDGNQMWVQTVAVSPDGLTVASAGRDNAIVLWQAATGKFIRRIAGGPPRAKPGALFNEMFWSLAFSPDNKTLAAGRGDGSIYFWDPATGQQVRRLDGHKHWVRSVAFTPDGKTLASGSEDKTVRLWDVATGQPGRQFGGHAHGVRSVSFTRDGKALGSGSEHSLLIWDLATGNVMPNQVGKLAFDGLSMALSPDGKTVAVGGGHGSFETHLLDLATGNQIGKYPHKDAVWHVAFSPDGKTLASAGHDHKVGLLDVATGKVIASLDGQQGPVFCVAFSSDSKTLLSGGEDTTILQWDVKRLRQSAELDNPKDKTPTKSKEDKEPARPAGPKPDKPAEKQSTDKLSQKQPAPADKKSNQSDQDAIAYTAKKLDAFWSDLVSDDAGKAYDAIVALAAAPKQAVPFLRERLLAPPPKPPAAQTLARLIADLDSSEFAARTKAKKDLEKMGAAAESAMRKALAGSPGAELRQSLEQLLEKLNSLTSEQVRQLRAIQALEWMATPEAKQIMQAIAKESGYWQRLRDDAQASVARLDKRATRP
jgi:WD40 repeat protein